MLLSHLRAAGAVVADAYIPGPGGDSRAWQKKFVTYVNGHLADLGLAAGKTAHYLLR